MVHWTVWFTYIQFKGAFQLVTILMTLRANDKLLH